MGAKVIGLISEKLGIGREKRQYFL